MSSKASRKNSRQSEFASSCLTLASQVLALPFEHMYLLHQQQQIGLIGLVHMVDAVIKSQVTFFRVSGNCMQIDEHQKAQKWAMLNPMRYKIEGKYRG